MTGIHAAAPPNSLSPAELYVQPDPASGIDLAIDPALVWTRAAWSDMSTDLRVPMVTREGARLPSGEAR